MYYHQVIGISIFVLAVILSFIFGKLYLKKKLNLFKKSNEKSDLSLPKGEVTSPDAPWLDK